MSVSSSMEIISASSDSEDGIDPYPFKSLETTEIPHKFNSTRNVLSEAMSTRMSRCFSKDKSLRGLVNSSPSPDVASMDVQALESHSNQDLTINQSSDLFANTDGSLIATGETDHQNGYCAETVVDNLEAMDVQMNLGASGGSFLEHEIKCSLNEYSASAVSFQGYKAAEMFASSANQAELRSQHVENGECPFPCAEVAQIESPLNRLMDYVKQFKFDVNAVAKNVVSAIAVSSGSKPVGEDGSKAQFHDSKISTKIKDGTLPTSDQLTKGGCEDLSSSKLAMEQELHQENNDPRLDCLADSSSPSLLEPLKKNSCATASASNVCDAGKSADVATCDTPMKSNAIQEGISRDSEDAHNSPNSEEKENELHSEKLSRGENASCNPSEDLFDFVKNSVSVTKLKPSCEVFDNVPCLNDSFNNVVNEANSCNFEAEETSNRDAKEKTKKIFKYGKSRCQSRFIPPWKTGTESTSHAETGELSKNSKNSESLSSDESINPEESLSLFGRVSEGPLNALSFAYFKDIKLNLKLKAKDDTSCVVEDSIRPHIKTDIDASKIELTAECSAMVNLKSEKSTFQKTPIDQSSYDCIDETPQGELTDKSVKNLSLFDNVDAIIIQNIQANENHPDHRHHEKSGKSPETLDSSKPTENGQNQGFANNCGDPIPHEKNNHQFAGANHVKSASSKNNKIQQGTEVVLNYETNEPIDGNGIKLSEKDYFNPYEGFIHDCFAENSKTENCSALHLTELDENQESKVRDQPELDDLDRSKGRSSESGRNLVDCSSLNIEEGNSALKNQVSNKVPGRKRRRREVTLIDSQSVASSECLEKKRRSKRISAKTKKGIESKPKISGNDWECLKANDFESSDLLCDDPTPRHGRGKRPNSLQPELTRSKKTVATLAPTEEFLLEKISEKINGIHDFVAKKRLKGCLNAKNVSRADSMLEQLKPVLAKFETLLESGRGKGRPRRILANKDFLMLHFNRLRREVTALMKKEGGQKAHSDATSKSSSSNCRPQSQSDVLFSSFDCDPKKQFSRPKGSGPSIIEKHQRKIEEIDAWNENVMKSTGLLDEFENTASSPKKEAELRQKKSVFLPSIQSKYDDSNRDDYHAFHMSGGSEVASSIDEMNCSLSTLKELYSPRIEPNHKKYQLSNYSRNETQYMYKKKHNSRGITEVKESMNFSSEPSFPIEQVTENSAKRQTEKRPVTRDFMIPSITEEGASKLSPRGEALSSQDLGSLNGVSATAIEAYQIEGNEHNSVKSLNESTFLIHENIQTNSCDLESGSVSLLRPMYEIKSLKQPSELPSRRNEPSKPSKVKNNEVVEFESKTVDTEAKHADECSREDPDVLPSLLTMEGTKVQSNSPKELLSANYVVEYVMPINSNSAIYQPAKSIQKLSSGKEPIKTTILVKEMACETSKIQGAVPSSTKRENSTVSGPGVNLSSAMKMPNVLSSSSEAPKTKTTLKKPVKPELWCLVNSGVIKPEFRNLTVHTPDTLLFASVHDSGHIISETGKSYSKLLHWCLSIPNFFRANQKPSKAECYKRVFYQGRSLAFYKDAYDSLVAQKDIGDEPGRKNGADDRACPSATPQGGGLLLTVLNLSKMKLLLIGDNEVGEALTEIEQWDDIDKWET